MKATFLLAAFCLTAPIVHAQDLQPPITSRSLRAWSISSSDCRASAAPQHRSIGTCQKKSAIKQVLKTSKVDVLTLSPIWLPDDDIEHNPALRVTMQEY